LDALPTHERGGAGSKKVAGSTGETILVHMLREGLRRIVFLKRLLLGRHVSDRFEKAGKKASGGGAKKMFREEGDSEKIIGEAESHGKKGGLLFSTRKSK